MGLRKLLVATLSFVIVLFMTIQLVDFRVGEDATIPLTETNPTSAPAGTDVPVEDVPADNEPDVFYYVEVQREGEWDDDSMVLYDIAFPRLVLTLEEYYVETFEQGVSSPQYLVKDRGIGFRLRVDWEMMWLEGVNGIGDVTVITQVQSPSSEDLQDWEYVSTEYVEQWGTSFQHGYLDTTLFLEEVGTHTILLTVKSIAHDEDYTLYAEEAVPFDFEIINLSSPNEPERTVDYYAPAFGELESVGVLMDWQGWHFGPCNVSAESAEITSLMDEACTAYDEGDLGAVEERLQEAFELARDNPTLSAILRDQLGLFAAVDGRWNVALRQFREALNLWQATDHAFQTASSLHNLGVTLLLSGRYDEGQHLLLQSIQLNDQLDNYFGSMLAWTQLSIIWEEEETIASNLDGLFEVGFVQADTIQRWFESR